MQILSEPRLRFGALQVATRLVDVERGIPRYVRFHEGVQHLLQSRSIGFAPEPTRPAETHALVGVVEVRRKVLCAGENGRVGHAIPMLDAGQPVCRRIPGIGFVNGHVMCRA